MSENQQLEALGLLEAFKLLDRELIEKVLAIAKTIQVEQREGGVTRISIDLVVPN